MPYKLLFSCLLLFTLPLGGGCPSEPCCVPFGSKEDERIFKEYHASAERGDVETQYWLGVMYCQRIWRWREDGSMGATEEDIKEGIKWHRRAAEQGHAEAQYELGKILTTFHSDKIDKEEGEGIKWYRKAAEQGCYNAQYALGVRYSAGWSVPKDTTEAVKWYRKAAEQQDMSAQCALGRHYFDGIGVPQDKAEAVRWFRKAAEQGNRIAQCELGWCYLYGEGVPKDKEEAMKWFQKSAKQNYHEMCYSLGKSIFLNNADCPEYQKEEVKNHAIKMLRWAELMGHEEAAKLLQEIGASNVSELQS